MCLSRTVLSEPQIPANVSSPTFSRIFGTNTSAFELLVLKRKIMGPCWLQIKKPHVEYKGVRSSKVNWVPLTQSCVGFLVQVRGDGRGPERYQPFFGDGLKRSERHTSPYYCESEHSYDCQPSRKYPGGCLCNSKDLVEQCASYDSVKTALVLPSLTAQIDDPTPPEALPCTVHTLVRPLGRFPPGFEAKVKSNAKGLISPMNNERMLLNSLLGL
jgi:DNA polymerase alpha subunit A